MVKPEEQLLACLWLGERKIGSGLISMLTPSLQVLVLYHLLNVYRVKSINCLCFSFIVYKMRIVVR